MNNNIYRLVSSGFPLFGVNKLRELSRLVFEISKKEKIAPETVLSSLYGSPYEKIKRALLKRRYPETFGKAPLNSFYLPKYETDETLQAVREDGLFFPENVFYVKEARNSPLLARTKEIFPGARFVLADSLKDIIKDKKFSISGYNRRTKNLFIAEEKYDHFKKCPCTSDVVNCGYSVMNIGMGCPYECSYCFLQGYQNVAAMVLPYNISDYLDEDKMMTKAKGFFDIKRIGSGEFTDSLVFDDITRFSVPIIDFFKKHKDIYFEFKTKSVNIKNLLLCGGSPNIVAAWSVNSKEMSLGNEHKTPQMRARLEAAKQCALAGFGTAFHFDPVIVYENWRQGYKETVDMIFDIVPADSVKWISLGTLRMPAALKPVIENRFPDNTILDGELLLGKDYKLRYDKEKRIEIYGFLNGLIRKKKSDAAVYLCMEEADVWKKSGII